jgi:hypothetical protein
MLLYYDGGNVVLQNRRLYDRTRQHPDYKKSLIWYASRLFLTVKSLPLAG